MPFDWYPKSGWGAPNPITAWAMNAHGDPIRIELPDNCWITNNEGSFPNGVIHVPSVGGTFPQGLISEPDLDQYTAEMLSFARVHDEFVQTFFGKQCTDEATFGGASVGGWDMPPLGSTLV